MISFSTCLISGTSSRSRRWRVSRTTRCLPRGEVARRLTMLVLRWGIVSVFLSFAVGSPHIGGTQPALLTHPSQTYSLVLPPARPGHLYVLDANAGAVLRFRLAKDGLPEKEPDAVLTAEGAELPSGLAVDRSGNM